VRSLHLELRRKCELGTCRAAAQRQLHMRLRDADIRGERSGKESAVLAFLRTPSCGPEEMLAKLFLFDRALGGVHRAGSVSGLSDAATQHVALIAGFEAGCV
jgi:hypothetical protein